jgi:glycosyltransferase involved in cell wall biosynthesis
MSGIVRQDVPTPIRVCLVGPSLDILGGQAVQAQRLRERLGESPRLEVSFLPVNPRLPGPLALLQRITFVRTIVTSLAYGWSLVRRLPSVDVVHAFSASYWSFVLAPLPAMLVGRALGKRVVLNYRSGEADDHLTRWRTAVPAMRLAHRIVVPSGYLVDVFRRHGLRAQAIGNFVELSRIAYRERRPLRPVFFSNRNFAPHYNVACVLRAFATIQARHPDAELLVAGDGEQREALHALARSLGLRHVTFLGQVSPSEMPALYDRADIYLNAPTIDNMPNSILEAFAAGLPVVTSDAGGIPYIVRNGETALMVSMNDPEALARGALRLLAEPELARSLAQAARDECETRYTWDAVRDEWERCYASLVATRGNIEPAAAGAHDEAEEAAVR